MYQGEAVYTSWLRNAENGIGVDPGRSPARANQTEARGKSAAFVVRSVYTHPEMPGRKEQTSRLSPDYVVGFVDGEGSFSVPISVHRTLRRRAEVRPTFEIELREDDLPILRRIHAALGCGRLYHLKYHRYAKWRPHVKLKVTRLAELQDVLIPFFERHPLLAKKRKSFEIFKRIVRMVARKEHLAATGFSTITQLRKRMNPR